LAEKDVEIETGKKNLIVVKGHQISKADYRGVLAVTLVAAFLYEVISGNPPGTETLGPFAGAVVGYYFHSRQKRSGDLE